MKPKVTFTHSKGTLHVYVNGEEVDRLTDMRLALHLHTIARAHIEHEQDR